MQSEIAYLRARGRFLSLWDCAAGTPVSFPLESPYSYQSGDYYVVTNVSSANPPVNYRPEGSSYTTGDVSIDQETTTVYVNDTYYYDGTNWLLLNGANITAFAGLAGTPFDNPALSKILSGICGDNVPFYDPVNGTYSLYDLVISEVGLSMNITPISTPEPFDSSKWYSISLDYLFDSVQDNFESITQLRSAITYIRGNAAEYNSLSTYAKGDFCLYSGELYKANQAISTPEAWDSAHWDKVNLKSLKDAVDTNADAINAISTQISTLLTKKTYPVTCTDNAYVAPYSKYGTVTLDADIALYGTPISCYAYNDDIVGTPSCIGRYNGATSVFVSSTRASNTVCVVFAKSVTVI